ncbi:hypothetical protein ACFY2N_18915 [Streptomyces rubiginosohelvolus]|uniref:hypothetical protein n=1 Tax=Streptomyces rubiginosohelvolus TaxID=67362 RepID=UPI0036A891FA
MESTEGAGPADTGCAASRELRARFAQEVDWSKVVDPYVPGQYGPDLLEQLWSPDRGTADNACANLHAACCGDGSWVGPAALELLPFLVEAARDPVVKVRPEILETLADLARAGNNARTAQPDPQLGGWRPTAPAAWPEAWEQAVDGLLPGLADHAGAVRAGVAAALARTTGRADDLIDRFRARFEEEPDLAVAEQLILGIGELTAHAGERREETVTWLRQRMGDAGKGEEPDIDDDIEAWLAWTERHGHDVRLAAIAALRRALPGRRDPEYARTTADALLSPSPPGVSILRDSRSPYVGRVTAADALLDEDLPGRLALARTLLRQDTPAHHEGGLRVAATLMSRWRSAVPELLPEVAEFIDGPDPDNRAFALRVLAMCGTAAGPWADRVAAHLAEEDALRAARRIPYAAPVEAAPVTAAPVTVGPADAARRDRLREAFQEALSEEPSVPSSPPKDAVRRARALWRATGDAGEVVPALLELTANSARKAYATPGGVEPLLLLAEVAATHPPVVDQVAERLHATARARIEGDCRFQAMEILQALWHLTRDGQRVAPPLVELVRICPPGGYPPTIVEPLEFLAEIATADPACAAEAAPRVRYLLDTDERPVRHDLWRAVRNDEALLAAVRVVMEAAEGAET